jgi:valyl-tRNA synthetase
MNFNNEYNLHMVLIDLRTFFLNKFCDFYVECTKIWLKSGQENAVLNKNAEISWNILRNCINICLLLYHPFIPSVTEQLWSRLKSLNRINNDFLLMEMKYPKLNDFNEIKVVVVFFIVFL